MDAQLFEQLNRRLDERHAYLCERLDNLESAIRMMRQEAQGRIEAHLIYHAEGEHRWGLPALARRHPFRLALLALTTVGGLWATQALQTGAAGQAAAWLRWALGRVFR